VFLTAQGKPDIDYDLAVLRDIATVLDARLDAIVAHIDKCPDADADGDGLSDIAEGLFGVGFVACQQYMVATASWLSVEKSKALACGPVHTCGDTVASIVNHAANYWKHGDEWSLGKSEKQQAKTQDGLEAILADIEGGYPLTVILARLVPPAEPWRFRHLLPLLVGWRDDLHAKFSRQ